MAKEEYVELCPICGSKDFSFYRDDKATEVGSLEMYKCKRCRNVFVFPVEVTKKQAAKIKEAKLTKRMVNDTPKSAYIPVGAFEVGFYWRIFGGALIVMGVLFVIASAVMQTALSPMGELFTGIATICGGIFLLLESFVVYRSSHTPTRMLKILLVLVLIMIVLLFGTRSAVLFWLP